MKSLEQKQVALMMKLYEQEVNDIPTIPPHNTIQRCFRIISEEVNELYLSCIKMSNPLYTAEHKVDALVEVADAIGDIIVTLHGLSNACGLPMESIFNEIIRSNLSKANPDGTLTKDAYGKVIKPSTYSPAELKTIVENALNVK